MRLSELLDKESVKSISNKTMMSEDNIEKILAEDYTEFTKAKTLGFLSILEREYKLNIEDVRSNAISYFEMHGHKDASINISFPKVEEKQGRSVWVTLTILALLGYASWYFITQFDQKRLHELLPFSETSMTEEEIENNESIWSINNEVVQKMQKAKQENKEINSATSSTSSTIRTPKVPQDVITNINQNRESPSSVYSQGTNTLQNRKINMLTSTVAQKQKRTEEANIQTKVEKNFVVLTKAVIRPVKRLWFGLINIQTGEKDHFSMRKGYTIDLTQGDYLVATSTAPFSLEIKGEIYRYNNGRSHYFKITKSGLTPLSKKTYVRQGGYEKW